MDSSNIKHEVNVVIKEEADVDDSIGLRSEENKFVVTSIDHEIKFEKVEEKHNVETKACSSNDFKGPLSTIKTEDFKEDIEYDERTRFELVSEIELGKYECIPNLDERKTEPPRGEPVIKDAEESSIGRVHSTNTAERGQSGKRKSRAVAPLDPDLATTEVIGRHKTFCCRICLYKTAIKTHLIYHLATHTGEKPYSCRECSASFTQAGALKRHAYTHTGQKPFKCEVCPCRCKDASDLRRHVRTHSGERPFGCSVCSYTTNRRLQLKLHTAVHTGVKPYSCNLCPYRYTRSHHLKRHMVTHSSFKPFRCDRCGYECFQKQNLTEHLKRVHGGQRPYGCAHCHFTTVTKSLLARHISKKHNF